MIIILLICVNKTLVRSGTGGWGVGGAVPNSIEKSPRMKPSPYIYTKTSGIQTSADVASRSVKAFPLEGIILFLCETVHIFKFQKGLAFQLCPVCVSF